MSSWRRLLHRWTGRADRDLDRELRAHLDLEAEERREAGLPEDEALYAARRAFGNLGLTKEDTRAMWGWRSLERLGQDLRYGLRSMARTPGFTFVAVLTLALGIGATTAIFSVVKAVLLNQLPYRDADRLVKVERADPDTPLPETVDFTTTHDWRTRSRSFQSLSLYRSAAGAIVEQGQPELIQGMRVNYDYFDTLGVRMALGRGFLPEEDRPKTRFEVILTHALWLRRFGGDASLIGRPVRLNEASFKVVGVLPAGFRPLAAPGGRIVPEMYMPLGYDLKEPGACRGCQHLQLIGRLRRGVAADRAQAELSAIMRDIVRENPSAYDKGTAVRVTPLRERLVGRTSTALWVLLGAVGLVLLIVCANVANLMLSRASARAGEIAMRAALGASRGRLMRQLLSESLLLALLGGVVGVLLAWSGTAALSSLGPRELPRADEIRVDATVLWFTLAASLLTGMLFGAIPAVRASHADLTEAFREMVRSTEGRSRHRLRHLLVTVELALAFVLVMGAGLLGKSFLRMTSVNPGYDPHNVLTLGMYVHGERYQKPEVELNYYTQVIARLRAVAGVEDVAMVSTLPLSGFDRRAFHIRDRRLANPAEAPSVDTYSVSPYYFRVMRIPLKRGRLFTERDRPGAPPVALISEACARRQFPNEDAIGKRIQLGGRDDDKPWLEIVGVVGDVRQYALDRPPAMEAYIAQAQDLRFSYNLVARTSGDPRHMEQAVRHAFLEVDNTQPVFQVRPLADYLAESLAARTFTLTLLALFGGLALALAAIGIYGVISYAATLRTREVGVRMALGAARWDVVSLVLGQGLSLVCIGLTAGFAASVALTRFLSTMLYEVEPTDRVTAGAVALLLAGVAMLANYVPARRASRIDPMVALRHD